MKYAFPSSILITGGREVGGVASFAEGLREGFCELGIPAEVIPPSRIFTRWGDLRDPRVLKILSTTAVFAAPLARRTLSVAHGFPRADAQGWVKLASIIASYKLANWTSRLVTVSHYAAVHLRTIFKLRVDAVIHNPINGLFLDERGDDASERDSITFAGRLHASKGLDRVFPAIRALVHGTPGLRGVIIGDGEMRTALQAAAPAGSRIEFTGPLPQSAVRAWLRRTRIFVSGCETEALGIGYLEALSQGCAVVMPACGGGLEIAPELIGSAIHLYSGAGVEPVAQALRNALFAAPAAVSLAAYAPRAVAQAYLAADDCRSAAPALAAEALS